MKKPLSFLTFLWLNIFLSSFSPLAEAQVLTLKNKSQDFETLVAQIEAGYGPLNYKISKLNINWPEHLASYRQKIAQTKSNADYYYLMVQFVASMHDSHFALRIPTDHKAELGFMTELIEDKILIDTIDEDHLDNISFPFSKGDEIVLINGVAAMGTLQSLMPYLGEGTLATQKQYASWFMAYRPGNIFPVPSGDVHLKIKSAKGTFEISLPWILSGTPLDENQIVLPPIKTEKSFADLFLHKLSLKNKWINGLGKYFEKKYACSGESRITIPQNAEIIMETPFTAYYYPRLNKKSGDKKVIGYLRLPHYLPESDDPLEINTLFKQYEYAISLLEKMTDGLVIDQDHNCGGSVDFMHDLASLLTTKPFTPIQFHLLANKSEYLSFKKWLDELSPFTLEHQQAKFLTEKIKKHWMQGDELTDLLSINGQSVYFPHHQTRYTKPIVVLIDQMAGSGGDAFPALLQGIGRAKLFGTTTMGAGGHVEDQPALPFSGLATSMTKSLFYRPDGVPVENQGAVPDRVYQITTYDFVNGYQAYQEAYTQYLEEFLP